MQTQNCHEVYYSCFGIFDRSYSNIFINYMFASLVYFNRQKQNILLSLWLGSLLNVDLWEYDIYMRSTTISSDVVALLWEWTQKGMPTIRLVFIFSFRLTFTCTCCLWFCLKFSLESYKGWVTEMVFRLIKAANSLKLYFCKS